MDVALRILRYFTVLAMCSVIAPIAGHAKEKTRASISRTSVKTLPINNAEAKVFGLDGYRPVSLSSTMMCAETLRGTLDCKQWSAP